MRWKRESHRSGGRERLRARIRADLERKGVDGPVAAPVAERLARHDLAEPGYAATLDGVAAAYAVFRDAGAELAGCTRELGEIERLMEGFAGELRKLEEGLQMVSAYLLRMQTTATRERGALH